MNEAGFVRIYLRKTSGNGDKITINPHVTVKQIYHYASHLFNLAQKSFDLFFKGQKLLDTNQVTAEQLKVEADSIIHIHQRPEVEDECSTLQLRVFCQGSLYSYQTSKSSTFRDFKYEMVKMLGCNPDDITVTFLGKVAKDDQTLLINSIKNRDLVSVIIKPRHRVSQRSVSLFKPKMAQSLTFANSQEMDLNYQPFSNINERMRKSSMKSSHESRELKIEQSKRLLQVIRPKSSLTKSNNSFDLPKQTQGPQVLELNNLGWLNNQKVIQTQSINFDEPEMEEGPEEWTECKVQLSNKQKTMFYTLDCSEEHDLKSIQKQIKRCENRSDEVLIEFNDENSQEMAESGRKILEIARTGNTKIIREVVFKWRT